MRRICLVVFLLMIFGICRSYSQNKDILFINDDMQLKRLEDSIYLHITWSTFEPFGRFSSNGMIIIRNGKALMIDTPADNILTEKLVNIIKDSLSADVTQLIIGHFHDDCMGGLGYLQSKGVSSIANKMTIEKCKELGLPLPSIGFQDSLMLSFEGEPIACRYFGAGHSFDNITVFLPKRNILFGGCLIKSNDSKNLGNLSDAVVQDWDFTVKKLMNFYPEVKIVIPGHGAWGGIELLKHTIELVEKEKGR